MKRPKSPQVERAIAAAGGLGPLSKALGITKQAVGAWYAIPAERVLDVEKLTGIPREKLRPDIFTRKGGK
jgi:DNA-binding transcriptional regulator YdaS (Cro superfamily)